MIDCTRYQVRPDENHDYDLAQAEAYLVRLRAERAVTIYRRDTATDIRFAEEDKNNVVELTNAGYVKA